MWRALAISASFAFFVGCVESSVEADFTGINLRISWDAVLALDHLALRGRLDDGEPAFLDSTFKPPARPGVARRTEAIVIRLPVELTGRTVTVEVDGISASDDVLASGSATLSLSLGYFNTATVALDATLLCGNGHVDPAEACDDGNRDPGDGCSARCSLEADFLCFGSPSRCSRSSITAVVDANAPCPGTGTVPQPFCTLSRAVAAPWASVLAMRAGTFEEQVEITRDVTVIAEAGAVLQSVQSPALRIGGAEVSVDGLTIRGNRRIGGGVVVEGARTVATLQSLTVGPGSSVGVQIGSGAFVELTRSTVSAQAGGGLTLDTDVGYIVTNNVLTDNGTATSSSGAFAIARTPAGSVFANNTVLTNHGNLSCALGASILNSILWDSGTVTASVAANCRPRYSDLGPLGAGVTVGSEGNFSEDPIAAPDGHLDPTSPCRDRGEPGSVESGDAPNVDLDGEQRPQGPNVDVGADEVG